jgi:hypothetical protein
MESGRRRAGIGAVSLLVAAVAWASCSSPESFHADRSGLQTGMAGAGGAPPMAGAGGPAGESGVAGDGGGPAGAGVAGDTGIAGSGAAGDPNGAAGTGPAGGGAAGSGAAGTGPAGSGPAGSGVAGSGAAGSGAGSAGSGVAGDGAAGTGSTQPPATLTLPFTVSDHYRPTGGMGDGAVVGAVTFVTDGAACAGEPAAASAGTCYAVTYQPQPIAAGAPSTWAGFFWQYPDNNWGTQQPQLVMAGAKAVTFWAKGVAGGEKITFKAGGIVNAAQSTATPFSDAFTVENTVTLSKTWTKYSLPMTGVTYGGGVLGGFCWVAAATNTTPIKFVLHGIVWEK